MAHAKLTEFAGYEMPLWYTTTTEEHLSVRNASGIFDVSHMGRISVSGRDASAFLDSLVPSEVGSQPPSKAVYTVLLNDKGGIIDDLIMLKLAESEYLLVVNASNAAADFRHLQSNAPGEGVEIEDNTESSAMMAVQGPSAESVLQPLCDSDLGVLKRLRSMKMNVLGQPSVVSRTGYTGEDGFEVIVNDVSVDRPEKAVEIWERLSKSSAPCGLSARDSLRLEAGLPLHGHDIDANTDPMQAGLGWVVSAGKTGYVGCEALSGYKNSSPEVVRRGAVLREGIPREGFGVVSGSETLGTVTSGTFSPILHKGIALCRLRASSSVPGTPVTVIVRGAPRAGETVKLPFYDETAYGWKRRSNGN